MAVDMFLKLGDLKGESHDKAHKDEIDVLAWSWGVSQSGTMHAGAGGGAGKVNVQDLSFTKWVDNTSPDLLLACCNGKHFPSAKLVVRKAGGTAPLEYIIIQLEEILVTSVSTGGSGGEDRLTENVTLNFARAKWEYTPQDAKGGAGKKVGPLGWDIPKNVKI
jgi:type VI secretion system secreted protein Hcp